MKKTVFLIFVFILCTTSKAHAVLLFQYDILMQAQTSLDTGPIAVAGKIINSGNIYLDLAPQWAALGGLPSNLYNTTCRLDCVNAQLSGNVLGPGGIFYFLWLSGTQEENLSNRSGELLQGSVGIIPLDSDWVWTQGGFIPELLVHSEFVNGSADISLPFNKITINLGTAGRFIKSTPLNVPIPEPSALLLLSAGLISLVCRYKSV